MTPQALHGVSLIIPALDEAEAIGAVVRELPWPLLAECLVVDNGSTDNTAAEAEAAGARVIRLKERGYGLACAAGVREADAASEVLAFMDGDGSDVSASLEALCEPILRGESDFVIGSRLRGHREPGSMEWTQTFAGWFAGKLIRLRFGAHYTDMGPMRAISRAALDRIGMTEMTYGWNIEMQVRAAQLGLRIVELPVDYRCRRGGVSKVGGSVRGSAKAAVRIVQVLGRMARKR